MGKCTSRHLLFFRYGVFETLANSRYSCGMAIGVRPTNHVSDLNDSCRFSILQLSQPQYSLKRYPLCLEPLRIFPYIRRINSPPDTLTESCPEETQSKNDAVKKYKRHLLAEMKNKWI